MNISQFVHPHKNAPWLNLAIACISFGFQGGMLINSYQAEGGWCLKTWGLAVGLTILNAMCIATAWLAGIPLIIVLCNYAFAIYHGYMVYKASQETPQ